MAVVVSDTSPIRALEHLGHLTLLRDLYGDILIPPGVSHELSHPESNLVPLDLSECSFIQIQSPADMACVARFLEVLDLGEAEALALALEIHAKVVLIDESRGREEAKKHDLVPVGVLGTLLLAKKAGLINTISPLIDRLQNELNFFIAPKLKADVLLQAGE